MKPFIARCLMPGKDLVSDPVGGPPAEVLVLALSDKAVVVMPGGTLKSVPLAHLTALGVNGDWLNPGDYVVPRCPMCGGQGDHQADCPQ